MKHRASQPIVDWGGGTKASGAIRLVSISSQNIERIREHSYSCSCHDVLIPLQQLRNVGVDTCCNEIDVSGGIDLRKRYACN